MILEIMQSYQYLLLFLGMLVVGLPVVIPSVYFALYGSLEIWAVAGFALLAAVISDSLWYFLGSKFGESKRISGYISKKKPIYEKLLGKFREKDVLVIFVSRFLYGTKSAVNILSGFNSVAYWKFAGASFLSMIIWLLALFSAALVFGELEFLESAARGARIGFTLFVGIVLLIYAAIYFLVFWGKKGSR